MQSFIQVPIRNSESRLKTIKILSSKLRTFVILNTNNAKAGDKWIELLVVECWTQKMVLRRFSLSRVTLWVQIYDLRLEYHDPEFAIFLSNMLGEYIPFECQESFPRNIWFLCIPVKVPWQPLISRFIIKGKDCRFLRGTCKNTKVFLNSTMVEANDISKAFKGFVGLVKKIP